MMYVIRLLESSLGVATPEDGQFLVEYRPARMNAHGQYEPGGCLRVSPSVERAMRFATHMDAFFTYRLSAGFRPDGKPNRPLTAWNVEIVGLGKDGEVPREL